FSEIELPAADGDWRSELVRRANSARQVLSRHHWAIGLMESRRSPGPATLRHHDAVIGTLRRAGFSIEMTAHAYALLDSYVYGFALQEAALPFQGTDTTADVTEPIMERFRTDQYPHLVEMATEYILQPGYDFGEEFEFGLGVILNALTTALPGNTPVSRRGVGSAELPAGIPFE
ncbi:MAG TPA: TetR/AcrR family transcriptional regulator C-terminal domain-containing protein, partial [Propionibacteriaceae bacterium]|nr:TetR/AcrR family transcriptional regulator C-terminal domain-containing protein [Propionibacteriaceae bacterium]